MGENTAGHLAKIIKRCYSPKYLEQTAAEMGETIVLGEDIFQALVRSGRALDFETAVMLVASHLDADEAPLSDIPMFLQRDRRRPNP